ncbi:SHOCT domain-containing protein [Natrialba chahannaoensis]|uniref:hypothetical protein n=1 Tax=Natrialba chahannaoensis TaxID=68911 RepID=UPI0006779198|nr:hypothetical protein [Natrialba chahannaoensis]
MNGGNLLHIGLGGMLGLVVVALILTPLPIGGMGTVPVLGISGAYLGLLIPVIMVLIALVSITAGDTTIVEHDLSAHDASQPAREEPHHEYDGREAMDILRDQYETGKIGHHEFEQRLKILLDADDANELRERLEWFEDGPEKHGE